MKGIGLTMIDVLDTNVLVRYLVGDVKAQQEKAVFWFQEARSGKRKILVKPIVVAETCFVLEKFYKKTRSEIAESLGVVLCQRWLKVEDRSSLLGALDFYENKNHFVDSFLLAWSVKNKAKILTFDLDLLKLASC